MAKTEKGCKYEYRDVPYKRCPHQPMKDENGEDTDYCIFHTPIKRKGRRVEEFWEEFEKHFAKTKADFDAAETDGERGKIELSCEGFIFPDTGDNLKKEYPFKTDFRNVVFTGYTSFNKAEFRRMTNFWNVEFQDTVDFTGAKTKDTIQFFETVFKEYAYFYCTIFENSVFFDDVTFEDKAIFAAAEFRDYAKYYYVSFRKEVDFSSVGFETEVDFVNTEFKSDASFHLASFRDKLSFQDVDVRGVVYFLETEFDSAVDFRGLRTCEEKDEIGVNGVKAVAPTRTGAVSFDFVHFHRPGRVLIGGEGMSLEWWSFLRTNVEGVKFTQEQWPTKSGRKYCFDERRASSRDISYKEAAEVYRKLRLNYEGRLAYDEASDFHYGQMVCRWKDKTRSKWDRVLTGGYWLISKYGLSTIRPIVVWLAIFVLFTVFYLLLGFDVKGYGHIGWVFERTADTVGPETGLWWKHLGYGALQSLNAALSLRLEGDINIIIRVVATVQKLLSATCITFFVLALRWKFKR